MYATHDQIAVRAKNRPTGYVEDLMRFAVETDERGVRFDTAAAGWAELKEKYAAPDWRRRMTAGAVGAGKALLGIDPAPAGVVAERVKTCGDCPESVMTAGVLNRCNLCGCVVKLKVKVASESCPGGRWGPAGPAGE